MTVSILAGITTDQYGDTTGPTSTSIVDGAFTAPAGSADTDGRSRDGVTWDLDVYLPHGTPISPSDELEIDGARYTIDGAPESWTHPFTGWNAGIVVRAKRAVG